MSKSLLVKIASILVASCSVLLMFSSVTDISIINRLTEKELTILEDTRKAVEGIIPEGNVEVLDIVASGNVSKLDREVAIRVYEMYYGSCALSVAKDYTKAVLDYDKDVFEYSKETSVPVGMLSGADFKVSVGNTDVMRLYDVVVDSIVKLDNDLPNMEGKTKVDVSLLVLKSMEVMKEGTTEIRESINEEVSFVRKSKEYSGIVLLIIAVLIYLIDTKAYDKNKLLKTKEI